jgi:hypothetical protein
MKTYLSIIGGLFIVTGLVIAYFIGDNPFQSQDLQASSKAYVEANVPAILSAESKDDLLKRSSPQLLKSANENPKLLDQQFQNLEKLGAMREFGDVKGYATNFTTNQDRIVITASYVATAKFENGEGYISVRLIQSHGQWQFLLFNVDSEPLRK